MIKFDCGRAPGPEKRVRREPDEVDRAEPKVRGLGAGGLGVQPDLEAWCPSARGGGAPGRKGCPWAIFPWALDQCWSLSRVKGWLSTVLSPLPTPAGHLQSSGETQPPSNPRTKDQDQELQEGVHPQLQPEHWPQAEPRGTGERGGPGRLSLPGV